MQPGSILDGKYKIIRGLGLGSTGEVYEAEQQLVGKRVAVKMLHANLASDPEVRTRFFSEAQGAARLRHANIVDVYDLGVTAAGDAYITMEYLEGETLEQVLEQEGGISVAFACDLMQQVFAALEAAHAQGIVHYDLKPSNIIITYPRPQYPLAKVLDFGLTKAVYDFGNKPVLQRSLLEAPLYLAPEVALAKTADARADVYSAAAILYKMLTDEPPFPGATTREFVANLQSLKLVPVRELNSKVPAGVAAAIENALQTDPARRPSNIARFASEIAAHATTSGQSGKGSGTPQNERVISEDPGKPMISTKSGQPLSDRENRWNLSFGPPRRDSRITHSLLMDPRFPRAPGAPRFESYVPRSSRFTDLDSFANVTIAPAVGGKSTRNAVVATAAGFGLGALLAWLSAML